MSEEKKKISLWQRLQFKYRISVLNEQTLAEKMYIRLNGFGAIVVVAVLFLLTMGLFSLVINAVMVILCEMFVPASIVVEGFVPALIYSVILTVVSWVLNFIFLKD